MKMNRGFRNFILESMVRDAETLGEDDAQEFAVLMRFVSRLNRESLKERIDFALERRRLQNG